MSDAVEEAVRSPLGLALAAAPTSLPDRPFPASLLPSFAVPFARLRLRPPAAAVAGFAIAGHELLCSGRQVQVASSPLAIQL